MVVYYEGDDKKKDDDDGDVAINQWLIGLPIPGVHL